MSSKKSRTSYQFSIITALYSALIFSTIFIGFEYYRFQKVNWIEVILFAAIVYSIIFFVIQFRVRKFIYRKVKRIYNDVSLLEEARLRPDQITTDMEALTEEVREFAVSRKLEIESLKVQEEYRKDFIGNIAHELKTPLFTVQGYILTLLDGAIKDKTVRKKYLERADKAVERMIYLVNDLDMITKLETGDLNLDFAYFNIVEIIKNTFDFLEMKASKKNVTLTFDMEYNTPIMVNADEERIQQLITNLIDNSIKYGKQDGTTEISIQNLIHNKIIIRVTDNGEGIQEDHITRLFERFYRVDKTGNRNVGGSGLGLSIVKHIIEAHEEKIYVESEFGVGSEFSFTLEKAEEIP